MKTKISDIERVNIYKSALSSVQALVSGNLFQLLLQEMWQLPAELRHEFVEIAILDTQLLEQRGIFLADGIEIQRSWFFDERPTLFCVTKKLPPGVGWKVATVTIDNPIEYRGQLGWKPGVLKV